MTLLVTEVVCYPSSSGHRLQTDLESESPPAYSTGTTLYVTKIQCIKIFKGVFKAKFFILFIHSNFGF